MKAFVMDVAKCNGCYCCQIACKDEHVANDWTPYAKPQPDTGQFWLKLNEYVRGTVPKVKMHYVPTLCNHCDDAPCLKACPVSALYKREDGLVILDPVKCTGCKNCVEACPYQAIYFNEGLNIAQKCTGCLHLLENGWKVPRCVDACPTECLKFGEESELKDLISKAEVMQPDLKSGSRVYYLNIPKKFIGGLVYDPVKKEVIIGAKCTLTEKDSKKALTVKTDNYGDFWFNNLDVNTFDLKIEADGFTSKIIDSISLKEDVNLGELALIPS